MANINQQAVDKIKAKIDKNDKIDWHNVKYMLPPEGLLVYVWYESTKYAEVLLGFRLVVNGTTKWYINFRDTLFEPNKFGKVIHWGKVDDKLKDGIAKLRK